jgi:hypothetical protein
MTAWIQADRVLLGTGINDASPALPGLHRTVAMPAALLSRVRWLRSVGQEVRSSRSIKHAAEEAAFLALFQTVPVLPVDAVERDSNSL